MSTSVMIHTPSFPVGLIEGEVPGMSAIHSLKEFLVLRTKSVKLDTHDVSFHNGTKSLAVTSGS